MNIVSYFHPIRTYLPCTGVGRHTNNIILELSGRPNTNVSLFFSQQWLTDNGKLDKACPLRNLPFTTFPTRENFTERAWKLLSYPKMDQYFSDNLDWLYSPVGTYIPLKKIPTAVTIHDVQAFEEDLPWSHRSSHRRFQYKWKLWLHKALEECRVVFTVSEFSKQRLVQLVDAPADKIVVSGNGVEHAFFEIANVSPDKLKLPTNKPYTLVIGGLRHQKGAEHVLSVSTRLQEIRSDMQILIVGKNESNYASIAQSRSNIHLLGMVKDHDLPIIMRGASSLLFLSLYEGFGIPALEAMAAGIPVVASNKGSLPEIIGDAGVIVSPNETYQIVEILQNFQDNNSIRTEYIQKGLKHSKSYTWEICANRVLDALNYYS